MQHDELDRLLSSEPLITPSPGFTDAVMGEIRREVESPPKIGFPWKPVVGGLIATSIGTLAALSVDLTNAAPIVASQWDPLAQAIAHSARHIVTASASKTSASIASAAICMLVPMAVYELVLTMTDRTPRLSA